MKKPSDNKRDVIDICVQAAINENSHGTMAVFLVRTKPWKGKIFARKFIQMIEKSMKNQGFVFDGINTMVSYISEYALGLYRQKYQRQTIKKWIDGKILPPREILLQLCLGMLLTEEESNCVLRAAGYPALYFVNALDIVTIYYLRKFHPLKTLSEDQFEEVNKGYERVLKLMPEMKIYGKRKYNAEEEQIHVIQNMERKKKGKNEYYMDSDTGSYYEIKKEKEIVAHPLKGARPAYNRKVRDYFVDNKKEFLSETRNNKFDITQYMKTDVEKYMESDKDFFDFIENNIKYLGQIHYGLFQQMSKYLETSDYYKKNVYSYSGTFWPEDEGKILKEENREEEIIYHVEEVFQKKGITDKKNLVTTLLAMEHKHLNRNNNNYHEELLLRGAGSFSDISKYFDGRREKNIFDGDVKYRYETPSKIQLIRMLIAMGREDEIGSMMIKIGYWDKDWIIDRDVDQCDYLDASDLLIIYMVRFRNCLLGEWAKKQGKEEKTYINQNRGLFPFHRMSLEISYDIQSTMKAKMNIYETETIEKYFPVYNAKKKRGGEEDEGL